MATVLSLIRKRTYAQAKELLGRVDFRLLASEWPAFRPIEKLLAFKLMEPGRASEYFAVLPFEDKYFLYCGAPLETIAPILEDLPAPQRRLFHQLPRGFAEKMFRNLLENNQRAQAAAR